MKSKHILYVFAFAFVVAFTAFAFNDRELVRYGYGTLPVMATLLEAGLVALVVTALAKFVWFEK